MIKLTEDMFVMLSDSGHEYVGIDFTDDKDATDDDLIEIQTQILADQKLRESVERQKINTKAVLSDDSPNKEELQRLLNLFDYLLQDKK